MLLNNASGLEKSGRVDAVGYCAAYRLSDCHTVSFASDDRPAPWRRPSDDSLDAVETLLATVLLTIVTFDESSSMIAPPRSAEPFSSIMLLRMLTGASRASRTKM